MRAKILFLATTLEVSHAIAAMLDSNDFDVTRTDDSRHAAALLRANHFDLLVVEVKTARDDEGLGLLRHVKGTAPQLGGRIVAISGDPTAHVQRELDAIGICEIVLKPVHEDDILAAVNECLDRTPATVH
ncbi:MAG TPA: response regulator [Thermoanaerobaculia bacterium]|jgi:DNA-binding NtrC family response regulator